MSLNDVLNMAAFLVIVGAVTYLSCLDATTWWDK